MLTTLAAGVLLGFSAGLAPGPMLALVLAQSLQHGAREGCKVALTPLVTDTPIILIALAVATRLAQLHFLLGLLSLGGACFVLYLAWESFGALHATAAAPAARPRSWLKGAVTNLLNPHPWLFWLTVGAAMLAKALGQSWGDAFAFLFGFYFLLVGSKIAIAIAVGRSRNLLAGPGYRMAMRVLGCLLALFALLLFREGLKHLDVI